MASLSLNTSHSSKSVDAPEQNSTILGSKIGFKINFTAKPIGRPRDPNSLRARQPWLAQGISQRTYYRRAAEAITKESPPQQHGAHVAAWFATLGAIARLDHRAFVRRCLRPRPAEVVAVLETYMNALGMN